MKRLLFSILLLNIFLIANAQDTIKEKISYIPDIDGIIKTKFEYDFENDLSRFSVRNARFGAKGNANSIVSYKAEVDLSDEGKMKMLDAYVKLTPIKNLEIFLGQRKIPFGTDYLRNPADNMFANRSFVAKYINDGLRDIGFVAVYKLNIFVPVELSASAMNGSGSNNPQWKENPNYSGRIVIGNETGINAKANIYEGDTEKEQNLNMYGGELSYKTNKFLIETEYISRNWNDTLNTKFEATGLYIHSYYKFETNKSKIKYILPTCRYDVMGADIFSSKSVAERITIGVNFGFDKKLFQSEIRFNYENYLNSSNSNHTSKFTIEFVARF